MKGARATRVSINVPGPLDGKQRFLDGKPRFLDGKQRLLDGKPRFDGLERRWCLFTVGTSSLRHVRTAATPLAA